MTGARSLTGVSVKSYSYAIIRDVVSTQRNLAPQEITVEGVLTYHFTDDSPQTLAFALQLVDGEDGDQFHLMYLDPSLERLWKDEMKRG
jgi:hypothetical protein